MADDDRWDAAPVEVRDAAMLRAFAHPIRQRIVRELSVRTHARAADLAGWLGEPANALSFHLRTLAKVGVVREVPEKARDKRDRVWELVSQSGFRFEDPAGSPAVSAYIARRLDWVHRLVSGEIDESEATAEVQFAGALLTKAEAAQFGEELSEIITRWRRRGAENAERDPDNAERASYDVMFALGPAGQGDADGTDRAG
jgi:DNA-binding transcriptional ArsR family regulator